MIVYRASELGACTRRLTLGRIGYDAMEPPEKYQGYFARGEAAEEDIKFALTDAGWVIDDEQMEVVLDVTDEIKVVGHIDGTMHGFLGQKRILEAKRMNDAYFRLVQQQGFYIPSGLMVKYRWQLSAYMLATGMEASLVIMNGDTGEFLQFDIETPPHGRTEIVARVLVIEGRARSFATLDSLDACDSADYPCPFYYTHPQEDERERLDGYEAEQLEALGIAYRNARERSKRADEDAKSLRREIEVLMGDRGKVSGGSVRVTRYDTTRKSLDKKRLAADGIDLSQYESERTYPSLRVTVKNEGEEDGNEVD